MTENEASLIVRRVYSFAIFFGVFGFVAYFGLQGWRAGTAFALASLSSFGNFWLHDRLAHSIVPEPGSSDPKKPWLAGIFVIRYIALLAVGYGIVKLLGVNGLPVILGLLTSTAAVAAATLLELAQSFLVKRPSQ